MEDVLKQPCSGKEFYNAIRTTAGWNRSLSSLADEKAYIMIRVNAILLSVIGGLELSGSHTLPDLQIPNALLLLTNLLSIILSLLATAPQTPPGTFLSKAPVPRSMDFMFFGNFYEMNLQDYSAGMSGLLNDTDLVLDNLLRDVYHQGIILGRKYRLLRIAYLVFTIGLAVSVCAYIVFLLILSRK